MLGKAVRFRYCPATVSDVSITSKVTAVKGGKALALSRKSGDRSCCRYDLSFEEKETYAEPDIELYHFLFGNFHLLACA